MARKPLDWPAGVEPVGEKIRIRFTWKGATPPRRCETLAYPQTPQGIVAAFNLRAQVTQLITLGLMTDDKYAELFPSSSYSLALKTPTFGEYAQVWLDSREIVESTRDNYLSVLNIYWMPSLALQRIDQITSADIRKLVSETPWSSPGVRRNAVDKLSSVFKTAIVDGLIARNPCASIARPRLKKREIDPFDREEAELIINKLYETLTGMQAIYACYFEFAFFTGMRPCELAALKWGDIDMRKKTAAVRRVRAKGEIHERVKTKNERTVLLNQHALHALNVAEPLTKMRGEFIFVPSEGKSPFIASDSTTKEYLLKALARLKIRRRRQYDTRHTYATMCIMAGMNPAFIANQLGHSVQMLLSTYAKWLNSTSDWTELGKLENERIGTELVQQKRHPA
ncbi:putative prophage phiRv2 integrase [compost metagenome]